MDLLVAGVRRRLPSVRLCLMTPTPFETRPSTASPSSPEDRARYLTEWLPKAQPWDVAKMRNAMQEWDANDRLIQDVDVFWSRLRALATPTGRIGVASGADL